MAFPPVCANLSTTSDERENVSEKRTFPYKDRQVPGQSIEIEMSSEPWAQYTLTDGSMVKVKLVLLDVIRLDTHNDQGDPVYQFQFQQIIGVEAAESLKRKPQ
jgi:hypothetical protein